MNFKKSFSVLVFSIIVMFISSCEKSDDVIAKQEMEQEKLENMPPTSNAFLTGTFAGASGHTTTGKAEIVKVDNSTNSLVLTSFKTDSGPDLRIYLAEDAKASNFIEVSSKVENGNKTYVLPANIDFNKHKFVLIWCKAFSVSFGFVELKAL